MRNYLRKDLNKLLKDIFITGEPVEGLRNCLLLYTKPQLSDIAIRYDITDKKIKKEEYVEKLATGILESIENELQYENLDELVRISSMSLDKSDMSQIDSISGLLKYRYKGWVYLFASNNKKTFNFVLPDEISVAIANFIGNDEKLALVKKHQEMLQYLQALNNLYGIYETEQFLVVWNKYHEEKLDMLEFENYLDKVMERHPFFSRDGIYLVDKGFSDTKSYQTVLSVVKDKPYYIPQKADIEIYKQEIVDVKSEYYQAIQRYLSLKLKNEDLVDDLMFQLETVSVLDAVPSEIMKLINEFEVVFDDMNDVNRFMKLYFEWHNHTRIWSERGFTPAELRKTKINEPYAIPPTIQISHEKIGRNDPCPCGSGRKYKQCCGR